MTESPGAGPFQQHDAASLAKWPRDPHKLVALLLDSQGAGRGTPAEALVNATDLYGDGVSIPADLRSAVLKAMALIPGIEVVDDDITSDGRHGVGFAVVDTQSECRPSSTDRWSRSRRDPCYGTMSSLPVLLRDSRAR